MNTFKDFKKIYISILAEENKISDLINYHDIHRIKNSIIKPISINALKNVFKNIRFVDLNDKLLYTEDIVLESPGTLEYPEKLCDKIKEMNTYDIIRNDAINYYIDTNWKYFKRLLKAKKSIMILKFDFSNLDEIKNTFMNFPYIENMEDLELFNEEFLTIYKHKNDLAGTLPLSDLVIMMFNIKYELDKLTILHEFTHYLQDSFGVEMFKHKKKKFDIKKLDFLKKDIGIIQDIIDTIKDFKEIIPYVNEFDEYVRQIFEKSFNKKFDPMFIDFIVQKLVNSQDFNNESFVKMYQQISSNGLMSLYVILACYVYDVKWEKLRGILIKSK